MDGWFEGRDAWGHGDLGKVKWGPAATGGSLVDVGSKGQWWGRRKRERKRESRESGAKEWDGERWPYVRANFWVNYSLVWVPLKMVKRGYLTCRIAMQQKGKVREIMRPTQCTQNHKNPKSRKNPRKLSKIANHPLLYPNELKIAQNFTHGTHTPNPTHLDCNLA